MPSAATGKKMIVERKPRVIELDISHGCKDGRISVALVGNHKHKARRASSSSRSGSSGMTRFEAAREAALAWTGSSGSFGSSASSGTSLSSGASFMRRLVSRKQKSPKSPPPKPAVRRSGKEVICQRRKASTTSKRVIEAKSGRSADGNQSQSAYSDDEGSSGSDSDDSEVDLKSPSPQYSQPLKDSGLWARRRVRSKTDSDTADNENTLGLRGGGLDKSTKHAAFRVGNNARLTAEPAFSLAQPQHVDYRNHGQPHFAHGALPGHMHHPAGIPFSPTTWPASQMPQAYPMPPHTHGYQMFYYVPQSYQYPAAPLVSPACPAQTQQTASVPRAGPVQQSPSFEQTSAPATATTPRATCAHDRGNSRPLQIHVPQVVVYTTGSSPTETTSPSPTYIVQPTQASGVRGNGRISSSPSHGSLASAASESTTRSCGTAPRTSAERQHDRQSHGADDADPRTDSRQSRGGSRTTGRLLGPLSRHYFCFGCGKVRSKRFHMQNPLRENQDPGTNYCANCRREHEAQRPSPVLSPDFPDLVIPETSTVGPSSRVGYVARDVRARRQQRDQGNEPPRNKKRQEPLNNRHLKVVDSLEEVRRGYRVPSVESVLESTLGSEKRTRGSKKHRSDDELLQYMSEFESGADRRGRGARGDIKEKHVNSHHANEDIVSPLADSTKQVRFDKRLNEWIEQSSSALSEEYQKDWEVPTDYPSSGDALYDDADESDKTSTVVGPCPSLVVEELESEDDELAMTDPGDDNQAAFAVPTRCHTSKDHKRTDEVPVNAEPTLYTGHNPPQPSNPKLESPEHLHKAYTHRGLNDDPTPITTTTTTSRRRHAHPTTLFPSFSAFQFPSGPHDYTSSTPDSAPPPPASAPPTRKAFDFSSLGSGTRDMTDPFYAHAPDDWAELERRLAESRAGPCLAFADAVTTTGCEVDFCRPCPLDDDDDSSRLDDGYHSELD